MAKPLIERIHAGSIPEPNSGCWLWDGGKERSGRSREYGRIRLAGSRERMGVHRASWLAFKGEIPAGMHVLHKCDMPCCTNPEHLFLGTHAENMADKARKGRQAKGERLAALIIAGQQRGIMNRNGIWYK